MTFRLLPALVICAFLPAQKLPGQSNSQPSSIFLDAQLSSAKCYVGQPVVLTLIWGVSEPLEGFKAVNIQIPVLRSEVFKNYDSEKTKDQPDKRSLGIPLSGTRAYTRRSELIRDNMKFETLTVKKILIPQEPGSYEIQPATISCVSAPAPRSIEKYQSVRTAPGSLYQYPLFFNNNFFNYEISPEDRSWTCVSQTNAIEIMPLPEPCPESFSGLVGDYAMSASASVTSVRNGDPITLTISVASTGYLAHVVIPPLETQTNLANDFKIIDNMRFNSIDNDKITYTQTILPLHAGIKQIPSLSLSFFDHTIREYRTATTEPICLTVVEANVIDHHILNSEERSHLHVYLLAAFFLAIIIVLLTRGKSALQNDASEPVVSISAINAYHSFEESIGKLRHTHHASPSQQYTELHKIINAYLHTRMPAITAGAITCKDVVNWLAALDNSSDAITFIRKVYCEIEIQLYFNAAPSLAFLELLKAAADAVSRIDSLQKS